MNTAGDAIETDFLVLRTTLYGEHSLIAAGIAPDCGRVSFLVHGAQTSGRRGGCPFGLFRRLHVSYVPRERELQQCVDAEVLSDHAAVSADYGRYACACWLSQFGLANVPPGMPAHYFFESADVALARLAGGLAPVTAVQTGVMMVYMQENGLMPPVESGSQQMAQCQRLLDMALGGDVPALKEDNWLALRDWAVSVLQNSECIVPRP